MCALVLSRHFARVTITSIISSEGFSSVHFVFAHLLGNAFQLLRQELLVLTYQHLPASQLRPGAPPASLCVRLEVTQLKDVVHSSLMDLYSQRLITLLTPWRYVYFSLLMLDNLDDNLNIKLVVLPSSHCSPCAAASLSFLARLTSSRSTSCGPLTSSPAFTFCASARTFTLFLNLCCSGSLCQTVPVAFDRSHCLQLALLFLFFLIDSCFLYNPLCLRLFPFDAVLR